MVNQNDFEVLSLTKEDILKCISKAREENFLDNLRVRDPLIAFDCYLRGCVGELAFRKWLENHKISIQQQDEMRPDNGNIDIDFLVNGKDLELKTSLIPSKYYQQKRINKSMQWEALLKGCDIKLIRRGNETIEQLKGDVHVQIYFDAGKDTKEKWLQEQTIDLKNSSDEEIYNELYAKMYIDHTYLVAWIDKPTLIKRLSSKPVEDATWTFKNSQRRFWRSKLMYSNKPLDLVAYLRNDKQKK